MQRVLAFTADNSSTSSSAFGVHGGGYRSRHTTQSTGGQVSYDVAYHYVKDVERWENNVSGYEYIGVRSAPTVSTV